MPLKSNVRRQKARIVSKKHLPKPVFEVASVSVARMHLASAKPLRELAESIWAEYQTQCHDPRAVDDLTSSAASLVSWLTEKQLPSPQHLLRHLQHFCQMFEDDGRPKKRRLFNGLRFQPDSYDPQRVAVFVRKAQVYCASAQSGLVPLAPEGYQ